jgi:hypothetical protein
MNMDMEMDRPPKRCRRQYTLDSVLESPCVLHEDQSSHTNIYDSVRAQFHDRLTFLAKTAPTHSDSQIQPAQGFLNSISTNGVPSIIHHSKAFEDSILRPCQSGESPCKHGDSCEAILMANICLSAESDQGFVCMACPGFTECLLCLRKHVTQTYFHNMTLGIHSSEPVHQFYNSVGPNEYTADVCLWPNGKNGISDPIVSHSRSSYVYFNGTIQQRQNVNFHVASSSIKS